jgi:uncharacterized protein (DUF4415 family)
MAQVDDDEIDTSDIPEIDDEFWEKAVLVPAPGKERLTIRLDNYVIDYFKRRGRGYQSRINAVLRSYVQAQIRAEQEKRSAANSGARPSVITAEVAQSPKRVTKQPKKKGKFWKLEDGTLSPRDLDD